MFNCMICKKAPRRDRYPRKWQWKTRKGLEGHRCLVDDERLRKEARQREEAKGQEWKSWLALGLSDRKIGDWVIISGYVVTSPMHRNGRHVRYDEIHKFSRECR